jgi:predicted acetyltransferase
LEREIRNTKADYGWKTECILNDESVSRVYIMDRTMRIGSAEVKMGGIGGVGTERKHRNKGYSRLCMEAASELMEREAYGMAFLFGIRDFYDKYGYATAMAEHTLLMDTRDAERAKPSLKSRAATKKDLPAIARIYNRDNATTGSCVRSISKWTGFQMGSGWGRKVATRVVLDERAKVIGYTAYDDETDRCCAAEIGGNDGRVFETILKFLANRAVELRREKVGFKLPADHSFARWARQFGLKDITRYPRNGNAMARITHLESCVESVLGELSHRSTDYQGKPDLRIITDIGTVTLTRKNGSLVRTGSLQRSPTVRLGQNHLAQLLLGYITPADLIRSGSLKAPKTIHGYLEQLFPLQTSQLWWSDRF